MLNMHKIVTLSLIALVTSIVTYFSLPDINVKVTPPQIKEAQAASLELQEHESIMVYSYSNETGHYFIDLQAPLKQNIVYIPLELIDINTLYKGKRFIIGYYANGREMEYFYPAKF